MKKAIEETIIKDHFRANFKLFACVLLYRFFKSKKKTRIVVKKALFKNEKPL